ncbi:hypothetical protein ACV229_10765 [Burkholderia sp. MR1-5-21]
MHVKIRVILIVAIIQFSSCAVGGVASAAEPSRLIVDMEQQCVISVMDYFKGNFSSGAPLNASYWSDNPLGKVLAPRFGVNFVCINLMEKSKEEVAHQHGASYDRHKKKWIPYFESERDSWILGAFTKVYSLEAINGNGFYLIQDDRDGDPAQRERYMTFCIFHNKVAVCGGEPVMYVSDPDGDLLPYILNILRSVEFVDRSGSKAAAASGPIGS